MRKKDDNVLAKQGPGLQPTITPDRQLLQPIGDGHIHLRQDREQTAGASEQETHDKEVPIKSEPNLEPICEDLWAVLDELGEILDEEQADSALELNPEITPPPPPFCLVDDTSLFTRRSNPANDRFAIVVNEPIETPCKAKNSKQGEVIENGETELIELHDSNSQNKPISSTANAVHGRKPRARSSSSEDTGTSRAKRGSESDPKRLRPTSNERRSANRKKETHNSSSAAHKPRSKDLGSDSNRLRNSPSQSNQKRSTVKSREWNSKQCMSDQKRRRSKSSDRVKITTRRSHSKLRNSPIRSRRSRSISQNAKYFKGDQKRRRSKSNDRVKVRTWRRLSKSPIRSRDRSRSISQSSKYCKAYQRRHRKPSSDRVRTRRKSSPRERLDRRPTSRCRSRSPRNMHRPDYIRYPHTEKIQRRRNSSSSPKKSHHISRYSPIRWPRQRSKSRSNSRKFSRSRHSRSRSPRSKFIIRNVCNNGRPKSTRRSRSRSVCPPPKLRERSRSIDRPSNVMNSPRLFSKLRIRHTSRTTSPSAQSPPLLDETMTAVQVPTSYQTNQSEEQGLQPMRSASPVSISPRPIDPIITRYNREIPTSSRRQQLLTPSTPYMIYMRTHFANFSPTPANLGPFDLRHRLQTSRYLGPNYMHQRIQTCCVQNTYLPPPAFNTHGQWPSDCALDYNSSGYY